jgi:hypothetical protein
MMPTSGSSSGKSPSPEADRYTDINNGMIILGVRTLANEHRRRDGAVV